MKRALVGLVVVLAVASSSLGVVIGNFETDLEGWHLPDGSVGALSQSTTGATLGSQALQVENDGGWDIATLVDAKGLRDILGSAGSTVSLDLTVLPDEINSPWMNIEIVINGQNNDESGPQNNIGWQTLGAQPVALDGATHTHTWALDSSLSTAIAGTDDGIWWFEIALVSNLEGNATKFYADNIQVVPEPATMLMLGLGGLAAIRRRRA